MGSLSGSWRISSARERVPVKLMYCLASAMLPSMDEGRGDLLHRASTIPTRSGELDRLLCGVFSCMIKKWGNSYATNARVAPENAQG
jgi:hypothetical protein